MIPIPTYLLSDEELTDLRNRLLEIAHETGPDSRMESALSAIECELDKRSQCFALRTRP